MNERMQEMLDKGYSPVAIAMAVGGAVGTIEYYRVLKQLDPNWGQGCPYCGEPCFGTGDCNCQDR